MTKEKRRLRYWIEQATLARIEVKQLKETLHSISLGSSNSMTTKEDLGKQAREALMVE
jgi:FtsZ-binding cell division protein ZapB